MLLTFVDQKIKKDFSVIAGFSFCAQHLKPEITEILKSKILKSDNAASKTFKMTKCYPTLPLTLSLPT